MKKPELPNLSQALKLGPNKGGVQGVRILCGCSTTNGAGSGGGCKCGSASGGGGGN